MWYLTQENINGTGEDRMYSGKVFFFARNFEKFVKNEIGRARTIWGGIEVFQSC